MIGETFCEGANLYENDYRSFQVDLRERLFTPYLDFEIYNILKSFSRFLEKSEVCGATPSKLPPLKSPAKGFLEVPQSILTLRNFYSSVHFFSK